MNHQMTLLDIKGHYLRRHALKFSLMTIILIVCVFISALYAEKMPVPANIQITLLLKILTYDHALKERAPESIIIGILYVPSDDDSKVAMTEVVEVMSKNAERTISKIPFSHLVVKWESADKLLALIKEKKINLLYVAPGNGANIPAIMKICREQKILSMTGIPKYAEDGLSISVGRKDEKPEIIINLAASKAEGADLDAKLLKIAKVIESPK